MRQAETPDHSGPFSLLKFGALLTGALSPDPGISHFLSPTWQLVLSHVETPSFGKI